MCVADSSHFWDKQNDSDRWLIIAAVIMLWKIIYCLIDHRIYAAYLSLQPQLKKMVRTKPLEVVVNTDCSYISSRLVLNYYHRCLHPIISHSVYLNWERLSFCSLVSWAESSNGGKRTETAEQIQAGLQDQGATVSSCNIHCFLNQSELQGKVSRKSTLLKGKNTKN